MTTADRPALDPAAETILGLINALDGPGLEEMRPDEARAAYAALNATAPEGDAVASVEETEIAGVPCIISVPEAEPTGVLVWLHGGGWVIGSASQSQSTARALAARTPCVVVNVDYRLAPEHPFPGPLTDALDVTTWVRDNVDDLLGRPGPVAVGGDSAGGNLAAVTAIEVPGLAGAVLVYPVTDARLGHPSIEENGEGYFLTASVMRWFTDHYVGAGDAGEPRVSPLLTPPEALRAVPTTAVVTAGYDPLRDEGEAYVAHLAAAGVEVEHLRYPDQIHGFVGMSGFIPAGEDALHELARWLGGAFTA